MTVLLILMGVDILTGYLKGIFNKDLQSGLLLKGIIKKFTALALIISIKVLSLYNYLPVDVFIATTTFFIIEQFISIMENYIDIGGIIPAPLKEIFSKRRYKVNE